MYKKISIKNLQFLDDCFMPANFEGLCQLTKSIQADGLLHDIIVTESSDPDKYIVIQGVKRIMACKLLDMEELPCRVIDVEPGKEKEVRFKLNMDYTK